MVLSALPRAARAAPPFVERGLTQPGGVLALDAGASLGSTASRDAVVPLLPGANVEGAYGITDRLEVGVRVGARALGEEHPYTTDVYARPLFTETYFTQGGALAAPEFRVRGVVVDGGVAALGLDVRAVAPTLGIEGVAAGALFGAPLVLRVGRVARLESGLYAPVAFGTNRSVALSIPAHLWFQLDDRLWFGPLTALRFFDVGGEDATSRILFGVGVGASVHSDVDLKAWILFPEVNEAAWTRYYGFGLGVQVRFGDARRAQAEVARASRVR